MRTAFPRGGSREASVLAFGVETELVMGGAGATLASRFGLSQRSSMSGVKRVSPEEASQLMAQGYSYVDVRTEREFAMRHPQGALNVPLGEMGPRGLALNPDFLPLMRRLFAADAKIVVGCASGMRSQHASEALVEAGFTDVVDQRAGMEGARGGFGSVAEKGWAAAGLPVAQGADDGSYAALKLRP
jgi:rhodanese-related sulfurtransferase